MDISWIGVLVAFVAGMVVAMAWYSKGAIADAWEALTGITPEKSKPVRTRNLVVLAVSNAATTIGLALAVGLTSAATGNHSVWMALAVGAGAWLALSASTLLQHNSFEQKPLKLTIINTGYQLALFLAITLVLGLF
ncbi:DUF1761 domain-containing protein [Microbacterium gorillae]|uniref:DUF1761 domain-containing protein n=1 Tax=Microbacterium gorillae TaxID=1231063 RepID=UPI00058AC7F4|nr:DUF1761 domain-containing protein [Microbacterium gorillae]